MKSLQSFNFQTDS